MKGIILAACAGSLVLTAGGVLAESQQMAPGCAKVVAVLDAGGGGLSAEEVAKRSSTDIETVRSCTDQWRQSMKDPAAPKNAGATPPAPAPGCAKIVGVLEQGGGGLSAEEVAKRTSTDIETVRSCTDQWRQTMKKSPSP